jgi:hypothetical protein
MLSAAAALGVVVSAQAQYASGDLLVGFTSSPGAGNDYILDIGPLSGLALGQQWTIPSSVGASATEFGVVGTLNLGSLVFATSSDSAESGFNPTGLFGYARVGVTTIAANNGLTGAGTSATPAQSLTYSWTSETDLAAGSGGTTTFENAFFNPNVSVNSPAFFFQNANSGTVTAENMFTYNSASGQLTYQVVPEPSTVSLLAVMGLAGLAVRRRLVGRAR